MAASSESPPPFSPVLLAGFATRLVPPAALRPWLNATVALVHRRHKGVFERLSGLDRPIFLIDPVDLPLIFVLDADPRAPTLAAFRDDGRGVPGRRKATAIIHGPLRGLLGLLGGRADGDSLFFSRELVIEGDTEAVVALRNAIDDAEIDLVADFLSVLGPLAAPARRILRIAGNVYFRAAKDLETVHGAILAPALSRADAQAAALRNLEEKVRLLERRHRRAKGKPS